MDLGRISAQVDTLEKDPSLGFFGSFAAVNNEAISQALFSAAEDWLKSRDKTRARGPFSLSINEESGALIEGFDTPPNVFMAHNPSYIPALIEHGRYSKVKDLIAYRYDLKRDVPLAARRLISRQKRRGLRIRHPTKRSYEADFELVRSIFNDANGEAVAFGIVLPNLNEAIQDFEGKLLPFNWLKLLVRLKRGTRSCRVPLMGVRRAFSNTIIGKAAPFFIIDRMRTQALRRGMVESELSWILEDNFPMRRIIEGLDTKPYKKYRIYEKDLH